MTARFRPRRRHVSHPVLILAAIGVFGIGFSTLRSPATIHAAAPEETRAKADKTVATASALPRLATPQVHKPYRFVVLGDTHYTPPDWKSSRWIHEVADEVRSLRPAVSLVIQTGDVVEGGQYATGSNGMKRFILADYEEMQREFRFAMDDLAKAFPMPVFIAVGNHDLHDRGGKAYRDMVLPIMSRQLGQTASELFYGFHFGDSCFLLLDSNFHDTAQHRFLQDVLPAARKQAKHVFLFAHASLWPVARVGFMNPRFTDSVLTAAGRDPIDAFFCGHTHNTVVSVRKTAGTLITQIQGIASGGSPTASLIPLDQRRTLLIPDRELSYYWGYLEQSPIGYFVVTVEEEQVTVEFRVPGRGVVRSLAWKEPGKLFDTLQPPAEPAVNVTDEMIRRARSATFCFCPYLTQPAKVTLTLNGELAATETIQPTYCGFWDERRIPIPANKLPLIKRTSGIQLGNPDNVPLGISSARIDLVLVDGRTVSTPVSKDFLLSSAEAQAQAAKRFAGWTGTLSDRILIAAPGAPLAPIRLSFPGGADR